MPCLLCGEARAIKYRLCQDCWRGLSFKNETIRRHEVECYVCCHYTFPMNRILQAFKDQAQLSYLDILVACLLHMPKPRVQAIVPMPISTEKLISRGFSQTDLLAKVLSKHWNMPIWQPVSRHSGKSQRGSDREERLIQAAQQLYLNTRMCKYNHVLILDDVITTGASLATLQSLLQALGCCHIQALCLCDAAQ